MRPFLEEFYDRKREVGRYMAVLRLSEKTMSDATKRRMEREARIFRAAALLVIYNAIEASARSSIQAIYDEIEQSATPFSALHEALRRRIIKDFKAHAGEDAHQGMQNVAVEMVVASFNPRRIFNGNVDAREIKSQATDYGFDASTLYASSKNGEHLVTVKNKRNDLAHGIASFSAVGKDYTVRELLEIAKYSIGYMEGILTNIDKYLDNRAYLST
ncbi:MAG: hypothetical protein HOO99_07485, partial [Hyphomicrobiaceae bacterium]|nr:hypothetical protein [Hyphomicrobiaceae bacterium]